MPAATAPLGKPAPAAKPSGGISMPTGLSRQTAPAKADSAEEEVEQGPQPVHIAISAIALLLSLLFAWTVYQGDQVPNRVSDYLFGQPNAADDSATSYSAPAADEEDNGSDDEEEEEEEEED